jgi:hypothetical protein
LTVIISHFLGDFHHVQILESRAVLDAELEIAFLVCHRVAIKSKLCQLVGVLDTLDALELFNSVVRQENSLQSWALVQSLHRFDHISAEIDLSETDEAV